MSKNSAWLGFLLEEADFKVRTLDWVVKGFYYLASQLAFMLIPGSQPWSTLTMPSWKNSCGQQCHNRWKWGPQLSLRWYFFFNKCEILGWREHMLYTMGLAFLRPQWTQVQSPMLLYARAFSHFSFSLIKVNKSLKIVESYRWWLAHPVECTHYPGSRP